MINGVLSEISRALLEGDVNIRLVAQLKNNVKARASLQEGTGANKRRLIQKAVIDELVGMLQADKEPYKPQKGKSNVILFVGLQVLKKNFP